MYKTGAVWTVFMKNMMEIIKMLWACLVCALVPMSANAKTIEVRSENFVFVGDVKEKDAKALVTELEQYRSAILTLYRVNPTREPMPVRIYGVRGSSKVEKLTGIAEIEGAYVTTIEGPVFVLNARAGFRRGNQARKIALHEYTHHLLANYTNNIYPRWYNEGLANYLATFEINKNGQWEVGRPFKQYAYALSAKKWMSMQTITNSVLSYPFKTYERAPRQRIGPSDFYYAQSWLAVHYIQSVKGEGEKMHAYLALLNSGVKSESAFVQAFGRTPEEFEVLLKAYFKRNQYSILKLSPRYDIQTKPFKVRELSDGMAKFHKAEAMRSFSESKKIKPEDVLAQYQKAEGIFGKNADILAARANIYSRQKKFDQALEAALTAKKLAPESVFVNRTLGLIYLYKNTQKGTPPDRQEILQARKYLRHAMLANADDVSTHYHYVKTFYALRETPSAQAKASAEFALDYYKDINFVSRNLTLASVLIKGGKYEQARKAADKALVWSSRPKVRKRAQLMLDYLDKKTPP